MARRIAFVHDWLVTYAGAERVLEQMLACFPEADLFSLIDFVPADQRSFLGGRSVHTSFLQRMPFARKHYRSYLPLMPLAIEQFQLGGYDIVISSSYCVAKGVLTGPDQLHVCMCYSPPRYAWDLQFQYLRESGLESGLTSWIARWLLHRLRLWDTRTAHGVDRFISISQYIGRRIRKAYGRESHVIYPPVDTESFLPGGKKDDFYLTASRLVPYKKIPLIIRAFATMPAKRLVVIGEGPEWRAAQAAAGSNITLLGYQPLEILRDHMQRARAFVFAAEEDFGIVPLEAQSCGTPVIAFSGGAARETIRGLSAESPTGVLFDEQSVEAIREAVERFERSRSGITAEACRRNAQRFAVARFRREFTDFVENAHRHFRQEVEAIS
jgi:glycosyltransferase involved in cell wall biosynthesis